VKKLRIFVLALLWSPVVALAGDYDGIWRPEGDTPDMFYFVYQVGGTMIMAVLSQDNSGKYQGNWGGTAVGSFSGNTATLNLSTASKQGRITISFSSTTAGTITATSCSSTIVNDPCPPLNVPVPFQRLL
jgi:hypothetical protein